MAVLTNTQRGLIALLGGFIVELVLGSFYLWGAINLYVNSYYFNNNPDNRLSPGFTLVVFPLMSLFSHSSSPFGVRLSEKCGLRLFVFICSLWLSLAVFMSSFMPNFWYFLLFYAILFGIPVGFLYLPPLYTALQYFPEKKGLISGIIMGGYGLGSTFSTLIVMEIINPHNVPPRIIVDGKKYFEPAISENVPMALRYLSLFFFCMACLGGLLMIPKKHEENADELKQKLLSKDEEEEEEELQERRQSQQVHPVQIHDHDHSHSRSHGRRHSQRHHSRKEDHHDSHGHGHHESHGHGHHDSHKHGHHESHGHKDAHHESHGHKDAHHDSHGHKDGHHESHGHKDGHHEGHGRHHESFGHGGRHHETSTHGPRHHETSSHGPRHHETSSHGPRHHESFGHSDTHGHHETHGHGTHGTHGHHETHGLHHRPHAHGFHLHHNRNKPLHHEEHDHHRHESKVSHRHESKGSKERHDSSDRNISNERHYSGERHKSNDRQHSNDRHIGGDHHHGGEHHLNHGSHKLVAEMGTLAHEKHHNTHSTEAIAEVKVIYVEKKVYTEVSEVLRSRKFLQMFIMMFSSASYGYLISANFKNYGVSFPNVNDHFLNFVGSIGAISNGGSRLFWGMLNQHFSFRKLYFVILSIQIFLNATLSYVAENNAAYMTWVCLSLAMEGSHFVIFPALCAKVFGINIGTKAYGFLFFSCFLSNLAQFLIVTFFEPLIGYDNLFWIFVAGSCLSFLLNIFFDEDS